MNRIRRGWRWLELPLVTKELNEQSSRTRTYVLRFLYGLALLLAMIVLFARGGGSGGGVTLGQGGAMFDWLTTFQFWALFLFVPAVTCSCLTIEKERNSLALLLITALRPWQIVLQKFLGRSVPIIGYVFLSLPLMAVAYSLGGLTAQTLWAGGLFLLITVAQTTALAVLCSAYFATTVEALMANYVFLLVTRLMNPFFWGDWWLAQLQRGRLSRTEAALAPYWLLGLALVYLLLAWRYVERRAFIPPKNVLLELFRRMDRTFHNWNRVTGGVVLVKDGDPLPGAMPVAWRETAKKSLGTFRYLFRVLLVLELPLIFILRIVGTADGHSAQIVIVSGYLYGLWLLALLMTIVHAASLISSERSRQTLDVLLTTPLAGDVLLREKQEGVLRLFKVLLVPFLTIYLFQSWWFLGNPFTLAYLTLAVAATWIFLRLEAWLSLLLGLMLKSQIRAVLTVAAVTAAWLAVPTVVRRSWESLRGNGVPLLLDWLLTMHPVELVRELERGLRIVQIPKEFKAGAEVPPLWPLLVFSLILHLAALWGTRRYCLRHADRLLGRLNDSDGSAVAGAAAGLERPAAELA